MDPVKSDQFVLIGGTIGGIIAVLLHGYWMSLFLFVAAAAAGVRLWRHARRRGKGP